MNKHTLDKIRDELAEPCTYFCRECRCCFKSKESVDLIECEHCKKITARRIS